MNAQLNRLILFHQQNQYKRRITKYISLFLPSLLAILLKQKFMKIYFVNGNTLWMNGQRLVENQHEYMLQAIFSTVSDMDYINAAIYSTSLPHKAFMLNDQSHLNIFGVHFVTSHVCKIRLAFPNFRVPHTHYESILWKKCWLIFPKLLIPDIGDERWLTLSVDIFFVIFKFIDFIKSLSLI